jgi:hypothetical protein
VLRGRGGLVGGGGASQAQVGGGGAGEAGRQAARGWGRSRPSAAFRRHQLTIVVLRKVHDITDSDSGGWETEHYNAVQLQ